jgi:hypothetical protein
MASWQNVEASLRPPPGGAMPRRPEELTPEFLTSCLRHEGVLGDDASVTGCEHARVGQGQGFAGELARVTLAYDRPVSGAPATLIAKFAAQHDATREMMSHFEGYVREVRFYRELGSEIGVSVPRCYFAHYEQTEGWFLLLLEDLAPASAPDLEAGLSFEQAKLVLEQIAGMHARYWDRAGEIDWLRLEVIMVKRVRDRFMKSLPSFVADNANTYPVLARTASQLGELLAGDELLGRITARPLTVSHNDLHLYNVFLPTAQGGRFALIDWQGVAQSRHGTTDVTRILCMGMRTELRRAHTQVLLRHYHDRLLALGVKGFPLRVLNKRYREEAVSMIIVGVLAFDTLDFDVPGGRRSADLMAARIEAALADLRLGLPLFNLLVLVRVRRFFVRLFSGLARLGKGV